MLIQRFEHNLARFKIPQDDIQFLLQILDNPYFNDKIEDFNEKAEFYININLDSKSMNYYEFKEFAEMVDMIYENTNQLIERKKDFQLINLINGIMG
jgi:hypothetical protein